MGGIEELVLKVTKGFIAFSRNGFLQGERNSSIVKYRISDNLSLVMDETYDPVKYTLYYRGRELCSIQGRSYKFNLSNLDNEDVNYITHHFGRIKINFNTLRDVDSGKQFTLDDYVRR